VSTSKVATLKQTPQKRILFRALAAGMLILSALAFINLQSDAQPAPGAPESFADLVERLQPAVVNISSTQEIPVRRRGNRGFPQAPEGSPFGDFLDQFRDRLQRDDEDGDSDEEEEPEVRRAQSLGSGFIIDKAGFVVTNNHVVAEADEITVITVDGERYEAEVIGRDNLSDLALLKIEGEGDFPYVDWGDSDAERVGNWLVAIGNPSGLQNSVSAGILSAKDRTINDAARSGGDIEYIQTDAAINRGNSGGPLFNMAGDVIGVNTAIFSPNGGSVGLGFSIPSNDAKRFVTELKENGRVRRGWLGVSVQAMNEGFAASLGLDADTEGALVSTVVPDSPADKSGFEVSDVIITWDSRSVADSLELTREVRRTTVGEPVDVVIIRDGRRQTLEVVTGELDEQILADAGQDGGRQDGNNGDNGNGDRELVEGMELGRITNDFRRRFRIGQDVEGVAVLRVARRSEAARIGIQPGTVIIRVNQTEVTSPSDVVEALDAVRESGRDTALVFVNIRGNTVHLPLPLEEDGEEE
jgi:serine protease Do